MNTQATTADTTFVTTAALAIRWGVDVKTARNRTKSERFPAPLVLGPKSFRWPLEEVLEWEIKDRRMRRVVTGTRPQHLVAHRVAPAQVKTRTRLVAA